MSDFPILPVPPLEQTMSPYINLTALGWDDWFSEQAGGRPAKSFARVAAVDRDQLLLTGEGGHFRAKLAGRYLHRHSRSQDLPCVGDWVSVERLPGDDFGIVHDLLNRKTFLHRRSAGAATERQMIAANLDYVLIVQSCHFDFNPKRLERYLVMVREGGAEPRIVLTKTDLIAPSELESQLSRLRSHGITVPVTPLSNLTGEGMDGVTDLLLPGKTYCIVGSSGVGKSTLINRLIGRNQAETGAVSGTGEGRHTTVRRELIPLHGGALVIDTPGMREFGVLAAETGIARSYSDIFELARQCRFKDCNHEGDPGCAVVAAVEAGEISQEMLFGFRKLAGETAFNDMSYAEKRRKDRNFGRLIKSVKKSLRSR